LHGGKLALGSKAGYLVKVAGVIVAFMSEHFDFDVYKFVYTK